MRRCLSISRSHRSPASTSRERIVFFSTPKSDAEFVDALFANAGFAPTAAERGALVGGLAAGGETRASVARKVAEHETLKRQEKNKAFVLMHYFGYLRRDADQAGFDFWLGKLDNHGGDFHSAEMARSFLVSGEYRGRSGRP